MNSTQARHGVQPQRRHRRVRLDHRIDVDADVDVSRMFGAHVRCLDVSRGGIRLRVPDRVGVGDTLVLEASLPGRRAFQLEGEVVHVAASGESFYEVGICWLGAPEVGAELFDGLVQQARREASGRWQVAAIGR